MKHILIVIGIIVVFIGGWWFLHRGETNNPQPTTNDRESTSSSAINHESSVSGVKPVATAKPAAKKSAPTATPKPSTLAAVETYQDALAVYGASGFRFQFAANCQASPSSLVIKIGQKFMLDNRDAASHKIAVGSQSYTLGAYGFMVVTASKTAGGYAIACDGNTRANVTVQP